MSNLAWADLELPPLRLGFCICTKEWGRRVWVHRDWKSYTALAEFFFSLPILSLGSIFAALENGLACLSPLTSRGWDLGERRIKEPWGIKDFHSLSLLGGLRLACHQGLVEGCGQPPPCAPRERLRGRRGEGRRECIANKFGNQMRSELPTHSLKSLYSLFFKILVF